MKPSDVGAAIRKRAWLVILLILVTTLVAAIVGYVQPPRYKAQITMVALAPKDPTTGQPNTMIQAGYAYFMSSIVSATESLDVARSVRESLLLQGIDIPEEELLKKASASNPSNSTSVEITFTDNSPTRVADIANAWGTVLENKTSDDLEINDAEFKLLLFQGRLILTNRATPPEKPTQPKPLLYVGLGAFLGLLVGLILVIAIEYFNPYFRNLPEVEESLGLPVYGMIPKIKSTEENKLLKDLPESSSAQEAYAQLRTALMFSLREHPSKTTAIIPAIPTDAAPYIPANLAISMAQGGRRTLLVDCDLRERDVTRIMGASAKSGLSEALAEGDMVQGKVIETPIPQLFLLPAGKASENPSDLLSMPLFDQFLHELEAEFEKIVISTPSLILSIDGVIVASKVDMSLVVVDAEKCPRNVVLSCLENFNLLHLKPTGIVLHNVKMSRREREARARLAQPTSRMTAKEGTVAAGATLPAVAGRKLEPTTERRMPGPAEFPTATMEEREASAHLEKTPPPSPAPETSEREERPAAANLSAAASAAAAAGTKPETPPQPAERPSPQRPERPEAGIEEEMGARQTQSEARLQPELEAYPKTSPKGYAGTGISPEVISMQRTEEELGRLKETLADDFRRLGATGAPLPREWIKALGAENDDLKEASRIAIRSYYTAFLRRYGIGEESVKRITESIMRMMRREGEFSSMNEREAQQHLQKMLLEAGARFSSPPSGPRSDAATSGSESVSAAARGEAGGDIKQKRKGLFRKGDQGRRASGTSTQEGGTKTKGAQRGPRAGDEIEWE